MKSKGEFNNNAEVGQHITWYSDGNIEEKTTFTLSGESQTGGVKNGPYEIYYFKNGQLGEKGEYYRGRRHGKWTYWYENGNKMKEGADGEICTYWYENGNKMEEGILIGRRGAGAYSWNNGILGETEYFRHKLHWQIRMREPSSKRQGYKRGKWTNWYESGKKEKEEFYRKDKKNNC